MKCHELCQKLKAPCQQKECRHWLDYEKDLNCTIVVVDKHGNLTLRQIGEILSLSFVRIKQIQDKALNKLKKRLQNIN